MSPFITFRLLVHTEFNKQELHRSSFKYVGLKLRECDLSDLIGRASLFQQTPINRTRKHVIREIAAKNSARVT